MRKPLLTACLTMLLLIGCASAGDTAPSSQSTELNSIRLPMGFIPNIQYAPYYVADAKGYYADAGFQVEFDYSFETDGVALVGAGEVPFALVSGEQVLLAREQEIPVVYVMAWFQDYPIAVIASGESGVSTAEDLAGKQIGLPGLFGASYIGLRALLNEGGVSESEVTLSSIGFNQVEVFAAGQEELVTGYVTNEPVQLQAQGLEVNVIPVADYVELAATGIITNEMMVRENPEMVSAFVHATLQGLHDTIADPEEAYELSGQYVEALAFADRAVQMEVLRLSIGFWEADVLGYSSMDAWENMQAVLLDMGLLTSPVDLENAVTNRFVE